MNSTVSSSMFSPRPGTYSSTSSSTYFSGHSVTDSSTSSSTFISTSTGQPTCQWQETSCVGWNVIFIFYMYSNYVSESNFNQTRDLIQNVSDYCISSQTSAAIKVFTPLDKTYKSQSWYHTKDDLEQYLTDTVLHNESQPKKNSLSLRDALMLALDGFYEDDVQNKGKAVIMISNRFYNATESSLLLTALDAVRRKQKARNISPIRVLDLPKYTTTGPRNPHGYSSFTTYYYLPLDFDNIEKYQRDLRPCSYDNNNSDTWNGLTNSQMGLIIFFVVIVIILILVICCLLCWKRRAVRRARVDQLARHSGDGDTCHMSMREIPDDRYLEMPFGKPNITDVWELPRDRLYVYLKQKLGSGAFCNVFKGYIAGKAPLSEIEQSVVHSYEDCDVAVKMLHDFKDNLSEDFLQEIDFMKNLGYHPHVVNMLGCVTVGKPISIIIELCSNGDLLNLVRQHKSDIIESSARSPDEKSEGLGFKNLLSFAWQISDGMVYLSGKGMIHRDVAARNILVNSTMTAKIGDFGLCRQLDSGVYTSRGGRLPIKWMAIESLREAHYSSKSDVWSFGVLLYEVYSFGQCPFGSLQPCDILEHLENGNRLEKTEHCPERIYEIMRLCWKEEPEGRPDFEELRERLAALLEEESDQYGYIVTVPSSVK